MERLGKSFTKPSTSNALYVSLIVITLALIPLIVYIAVDNHFQVTLTEDFTKNGYSDENKFGIIMGNERFDTNAGLEQLSNYKEIIVPYNYTSGEVNVDVIQPKTDNIIGFYNQQSNTTNYTQTSINSFNYENTENISAIYNHTDTLVNYRTTGNQDINDALFNLQKGVINGTNEFTNMSFYPPPTLIWEDVYYNDVWYEYWTPNASLIGKTFTRIYIPFRYVPSSSARFYVQIYNATTTFSTVTLHNHDIYNPSYSVINVLESDDPFVYYGGQITIKVWTNEYINWWSPIQVATQSPRSTNSSMMESFIILGIPFTSNYPNKCFYKGWIMEQNFTSNAIYSEPYLSEEQIIFNLTFPLQDYGVNVFNLINFTLSINDLFHNLTAINFIDGNVCFYDWNASQFYNFAHGDIENESYGLYYSNNSIYVSPNNEIRCQIVLRGHNQDFYMILRNLTFNVGYFDIISTDYYYTNYNIDISGLLSSTLVITNTYESTSFGYIYTEVVSQHITFNQVTTLATMYRILIINETVEIDMIVNRSIIYYLHYQNNQDFYFDVYIISTTIIVDSKKEDTPDTRVRIEYYDIYVYF